MGYYLSKPSTNHKYWIGAFAALAIIATIIGTTVILDRRARQAEKELLEREIDRLIKERERTNPFQSSSLASPSFATVPLDTRTFSFSPATPTVLQRRSN
jgi:hypothetical protein